MLKTFLFNCFGPWFNMGTVVRVKDMPGLTHMEPVVETMPEGESFRADGLLEKEMIGTPLFELLKDKGPYHLHYHLETFWPNPDILAWNQYACHRATLVSIRFMNDPKFDAKTALQPA